MSGGRPVLAGLIAGAVDVLRRALAGGARTVHKAACDHHWHLRLSGHPRFGCCWCPAETDYTAQAVDGRGDCARPGTGVR